ncbi:MAG TPA: hypothetical protein VEF89_34330 [Solirubrobacteraceae bacterium]|nr:hypothetical protein [Solirubrobacteraceae bacterium]
MAASHQPRPGPDERLVTVAERRGPALGNQPPPWAAWLREAARVV